MNVIEAIEPFFVEVVLSALHFRIRVALLAVAGIPVLVALCVSVQLGFEYEPSTEKGVSRLLSASFSDWARPFAGIPLFAGVVVMTRLSQIACRNRGRNCKCPELMALCN